MAAEKPTVTYVNGDGWEGLYINGGLVVEDHGLSPKQVMDALGIEYESIDANQKWLDEVCMLPQDIRDVKGEKSK